MDDELRKQIKCTKCGTSNPEYVDGYHFKCSQCGHFFDRAEIEFYNQKVEWPDGWLK
jgi:predicted RNA-binding Zn-ribbon protein involved in translation (DUF1610 family)